ncbi:hypothetical protein BDZ94DRAFT_838842 [Collybia nuda]|uniref:CFEM domain-containing protein n=1 Tax=Collybia nuda TaxID=64659 RepID=A0A9P5YHS9_9AGAR|nr:hypothetical protein BDZ94DRAFT_838842 [Collybia nuda]
MKLISTRILPLLASFQLYFLACAQTPIPPSTFGGETSTGPASNTTSNSATPTTTAEFPPLSGYSSCVTGCLAMGSGAANCTSVVDINCFCVSQRFTKELVSCISAGCPQELTTAESLAQHFCDLTSNKTSLSFPTPSSANTITTFTASTSHNNFTSIALTSTLLEITAPSPQSSLASNAATSRLSRNPRIEDSIFYVAGVGFCAAIFCGFVN